jgi:hypothetical protein
VSGQFHTPAALSPGKQPRHPLDKRLGGSRAGTDAVKRKISCPCQESNHDSSTIQPVARRYIDSRVEMAFLATDDLAAAAAVSIT